MNQIQEHSQNPLWLVMGEEKRLAGEGAFLRQKRVGFAARVTIEVRTPVGSPSVLIDLEGDQWESPTAGWKAAALYGVTFALQELRRTDCAVRITKILGVHTDTNATVMAAAAADAVWKTLGSEPPASTRSRIEEVAMGSWNADSESLKQFGAT